MPPVPAGYFPDPPTLRNVLHVSLVSPAAGGGDRASISGCEGQAWFTEVAQGHTNCDYQGSSCKGSLWLAESAIMSDSLVPTGNPGISPGLCSSHRVHLTLDVSLAIAGRLPSTSWYMQPAKSRVSTPSLGYENLRTQRGLSPMREPTREADGGSSSTGFLAHAGGAWPSVFSCSGWPSTRHSPAPKSYESCSCVGMFLETSVPV